MSQHLQRAHILFDQNRFELANEELAKAIAENPDHPSPHALSSLCYSHLERYPEAIAAARRTIQLAPEDDTGHYVLAVALFDSGQYDAAEEAIREALRIAPDYAHYHAIVGQLHLQRNQWQAALDAAQQGLSLDPEADSCLHIQSHALRQLNRSEEAAQLLDQALSNDPDDPDNHAHQGWHQIEKGDYERARYHFTEALRLNPRLEWARSGLAEVLKAKNFFYRIVLRYQLFLSKFGVQARFALIFGLWLLARMLRGLAKSIPELEPIVNPILVVYLAFLLLTWLGVPSANLLLRLHPWGKLLLDKHELRASAWVGWLMVGSLLSLAVYAGIRSPVLLVCAGCGAALIIPVATSIGWGDAKGGRLLRGYTLGLAGIAVALCILPFTNLSYIIPSVNLSLLTIFAGLVIFFWITILVDARD